MPAEPTPDPDADPDADPTPERGAERSPDPSRGDPFAPPRVPCEVQCVHCGESFESWQIEWRDDPVDDAVGGSSGGTWCCPTAGCDGIGFGFDIFPADPAWVDENGEHLIAQVHDDDDDDDDEEDDDDLDLDIDFGASDDDDEDEAAIAGLPVDIFDTDAFWIDADRIAPRALGNTPQPPFDLGVPPTTLFGSAEGEARDDDSPF